MTQPNVELVHHAVEAFRGRDVAALEALWHPEGEFRSLMTGIEGEGGRYRGGFAGRYFHDIDTIWDEWHTEEERLVDVGPEKVVFLYRIVGRGRGSGVPIDRPLAIVFTVRDGRIYLGEVYTDQDEALEAAGPSEQDVSS